MECLTRARARLLVCALAAISAIGLIEASIASANRAGSFQCRGTGLRIGTSETGTANAPGNPCRTQTTAPINVRLPLGPLFLWVLGVGAHTESNPQPTAEGTNPGVGHGGGAVAGATGVDLQLATLKIHVGVARAFGSVVCTNPPNDPEIFSAIKPHTAEVKINGQGLSVNGPLVLPLGILTLKLNQEVRTSNSLRQRVIEINSPLLPTIVIGETIVGYTGHPCQDAP